MSYADEPYDGDLTEFDELDPEGPSVDDLERFGDATVSCPSCGTEMYDQATICPTCGTPVGTGERSGLPPWAVFAAGALLLAFFAVFVF